MLCISDAIPIRPPALASFSMYVLTVICLCAVFFHVHVLYLLCTCDVFIAHIMYMCFYCTYYVHMLYLLCTYDFLLYILCTCAVLTVHIVYMCCTHCTYCVHVLYLLYSCTCYVHGAFCLYMLCSLLSCCRVVFLPPFPLVLKTLTHFSSSLSTLLSGTTLSPCMYLDSHVTPMNINICVPFHSHMNYGTAVSQLCCVCVLHSEYSYEMLVFSTTPPPPPPHTHTLLPSLLFLSSLSFLHLIPLFPPPFPHLSLPPPPSTYPFLPPPSS